MSPPYRLLATDLDGTLLASDGSIHPEDAHAIRLLRGRGVIVTLATGRLYSGSRAIARELDLDGPVACVDGSQIVDARSGKLTHERALSVDAMVQLRETVKRTRAKAFSFVGDAINYDDHGADFARFMGVWSQVMRRVHDVLEPESQESRGCVGFVAVGTEDQIEQTREGLSEQADVQAFSFPTRLLGFGSLWALVVRRNGVTKATGLEVIAEHHGIGIEDIVAVGDWLNDVPMLKRAGRSFAMGQAPQEVKDCASEVLSATSISGGGIMEAARRAGLL